MYSFTDEQLQLRESIRRFMVDHATTKSIRELMDDPVGYDTASYRSLIDELGVGGVHVPTEYGGAGLGYVELCIVLEEMGRTLYQSPFFASNVLAVNAVLLAGSEEDKQSLLSPLVNGETSISVAIYEESNRIDINRISQTVQNGTFTGSKQFIVNGANADQLILIAADADDEFARPRFWLVGDLSNGVSFKLTSSIDSTRRIASVEFDAVPVSPLGSSAGNENAYSQFMDYALVALANEMVGGAQFLLESSVEYSNNRVQFGRPISSMQAIKHKCADLLLEVELAKSAAYRAAHSVALNEAELPQFACMAKASANDAYMQAASDAIQIHGGIGFTWDNDTHFWFKRAKASQVMFGTSEVHRDQMLNRMGYAKAS